MATWKDRSNWRARYSDLYKQRSPMTVKEDTEHRISFINNDIQSYLINKLTMKNEQGCIRSLRDSGEEQNNEMSLLEMVRKSNEEKVKYTEAVDTESDGSSSVEKSNWKRESDTCVHGLSMRPSSPSNASRAKISRLSVPKDIDLASILAFTPSFITPIATIKNPEFEKVQKQEEPPPQWSIRRSVCPVCSQKWRDRSSIAIVKNSGLKRNSSLDFPSVVAPARLRSAVISEYTPRPAVAAVDKDAGIILGGWRLGNTSWELTRARKFRAPKPQPLPDIKIPTTATHEKINLDIRVHRFLSE